MPWLKWILRAGIGLAVMAAALYALQLYRTYDQRRIESELVLLTENGYPSKQFSEIRLVCFNNNNGSGRGDFLRAAERAGVDIKHSIQSCGVDGAAVVGSAARTPLRSAKSESHIIKLESGK